jgi:hypothetical protein
MRLTMRVSLPHLGHAVDFVVSMTFFRSAVFAIFAIQFSPDRNLPLAQGLRFYLGIGEYQEALDRRQPGPTRIGPARSTRAEAVHCTRL